MLKIRYALNIGSYFIINCIMIFDIFITTTFRIKMTAYIYGPTLKDTLHNKNCWLKKIIIGFIIHLENERASINIWKIRKYMMLQLCDTTKLYMFERGYYRHNTVIWLNAMRICFSKLTHTSLMKEKWNKKVDTELK